jgi:hypothetical protein
MSTSELDAGYYARLRLLVPMLVVGGVLLPLMAVLFGSGNNWALNTGLILAGVECLTASYLIHRSLRGGQDLPQGHRRLIFGLSGAVILLLVIAMFL